MNKPYGSQGEIINFPFKDVQEVFYNQNGIKLEIKDGILYVGVDDETKLEEAKEVARLYLSAWSERQNIKVDVDFNHTWKTNAQGIQDHFVKMYDNVKVTDRVQIQAVTHQIEIRATASLVTQKMYDSASPAEDTPMVNKAFKDFTLRKALRYFSEEVIDDDKPLYGIYKAIEVISHKLGKDGRKRLGELAGKSKTYVDDIMQTTDGQRHANPVGQRKLTDDECKERAKILINAYANSLS